VPRQPSPEVAARNEQIYALWHDGASLRELAEQFDRTPQMIGRILAAFHPDLDEDDDRALHRGRLESLYQDVQEIIRSPGYMCGPNGKIVRDEDNEPLVNTGARIEAARTQLAVLESMRKLDARDKPSRRVVQLEHSIAEQAALADIARRRAELEGQLRVIQGSAEPVEPRALPPAAAEG
jgi:hypothetical protein